MNITCLISDNMATILPESDAYVWGEWEMDNRGVVVYNWDAEGGYRCPLCNQNFQTKRKEIFKKHFDPKRKENREEHRRIKAGIPKVKVNCKYCGKSGDPNSGKVQKHLEVCEVFHRLDINGNKSNDEEEVADNSGIPEEDFGGKGDSNEETFEIDDDEYEDNIIENPNFKTDQVDGVHGDIAASVEFTDKEYEISLGDKSIESVAEEGTELETHENEQVDTDVENNCPAPVEENMQMEIDLLRKNLEVARSKHKQDEKTIQDLTQQFNSLSALQDEHIEEMEKSVSCLEEMSSDKMKALEEKLTKAKDSFEKSLGDKDVQIKHLEVKISKLEEIIMQKDEEVGKMERDMNAELKQLSQEKVDLEQKILEVRNNVKKEKEEATITMSTLQNRIKELTQENLTQGRSAEGYKAGIEQLTDDLESENLKNERLKQRLQRMTQKVEAVDKEPMIRSVKLESGGAPVPIGEGTYATVTKVLSNGKYLAIKEAKIDKESINEALIMSKLKHPNIVSAIGVSLKGQNLLISMDCYDEDLSKYLEQIEKKHDTQVEPRHKIFKHCATGLRYLHKQKIIHRDIKPQNILIHHTGDSLSASLSDFGHSNLGLKGSGWCGTRGFIAPEMYTDGTVPVYDETVDCWSLGASMYELLVGDCLVKTEDYEEETNPKPKWEEAKINSPSFLKAVKGLLRMDPKRRKSAKDVLKIL